jgi:hypothetical protein
VSSTSLAFPVCCSCLYPTLSCYDAAVVWRINTSLDSDSSLDVFLDCLRGSDTGILPHKFLGSSIVYWTLLAAPAADSSSPAAGSPAAAAPLAPSTGNKKKQRKSQSQQQVVGAGQSSSGLVQPAWLLPELLQHLEFTEELDTMVSSNCQGLMQQTDGLQPIHAICCRIPC